MAKERAEINDGGPAFPTMSEVEIFRGRWVKELRPSGGMSLRDWFAGQAMQAYVATEGPASDDDGDFVANYAYEIADAMMKERLKS